MAANVHDLRRWEDPKKSIETGSTFIACRLVDRTGVPVPDIASIGVAVPGGWLIGPSSLLTCLTVA